MDIEKQFLRWILFSFYLIYTNLIPNINSIKAVEKFQNNTIDINYLKNFNIDQYYILGTGDEIEIIVSRELEQLNTLVRIDSNGTIFIPNLNRVFVDGLTVKELTKLLNTAYLEFVKYPNVEIIIRNYRPLRILVKGEVNKPKSMLIPGSYQFTMNRSLDLEFNNSNQEIKAYFPTVFDAIIESNGITEYSDLSKVELIRKIALSEGGGYKKAILDLTKIDSPLETNQNIRIFDGDKIIVSKLKNSNDNQIYDLLRTTLNPEFLQISVTGKVANGGSYKLPYKSSLNDAIKIAGGFKTLSGKVSIARINKNATISTLNIKYNRNAKRGSRNNPYLISGDMIFVNKSIINSTSEIIQQVTAPFSGLFSVYGIYKAIND